MPGQNNQYGSQDDPFGYGSQQQYWKNVRANQPVTKPAPIKATVPTTPQVQPQPTPQGPPAYQSPYGRGYVPPNGGTQQIPTPQLINGDGGSMEPWLDAGMTYEQWMNRFRTAPAPNPQIPPWAVQPPSNIGTWNPPTQPALGIWNGPLPSKQPLPDDIYGFSKIYGKPIPEGQKWADVRPDRGYAMPYNPWNPNKGYSPWSGQQQLQFDQQAIPQWYGARLNQVR
jgi:hypothetical protein